MLKLKNERIFIKKRFLYKNVIVYYAGLKVIFSMIKYALIYLGN